MSADANRRASSLTQHAGMTSPGGPSATAGVTTQGRPAATASRTLFWTPRATWSGAAATAACQRYGRTSGTAPVTLMPRASLASSRTGGEGDEPTRTNRASGRAARTRGHHERRRIEQHVRQRGSAEEARRGAHGIPQAGDPRRHHRLRQIGHFPGVRGFLLVMHERGDIEARVGGDLAKRVVHAQPIAPIRSVRQTLSEHEHAHPVA
jgi:hypothetical protein